MSPPERDIGRRAVAALGWNYGGALTRVLLQLVVQLALARVLGPAAFGEAMAALIVLGLGWLFAEAGFGSALIQKAQIDDHDIGYALGWVLGLSLLVGLVVMLASPWLALALGSRELQPLLLACGALVPLQALANLPVSLMQRRLDMKRLQLIQNGAYLAGYGGLGMLMASLGYGAWSLLAAFALQTLIVLGGSYACVRHTLRPRWHGDAAMRRFGLTVSASNLVNWALDNGDRMMVSRLWGPLALGQYSAAANLARAPVNLMVNSAQSVAFSSASRMQADHERLARGYLAALSLVFLLVAPVFAFLGWQADAVVALLYGHKWAGAGPLFAVFCASVPWFAIVAITGPMLRAVNAVRAELLIQLLVLATMVGGLVLLSQHPLQHVAWLIPALALGRAALACTVLARHVSVRWRAFGHALAAGIVFAALALLCAAGLAWLLPAAQLAAALATVLLTPLLCLLATRAGSAALLGPQLRSVLWVRAQESRAIGRLCALLGVRGEPAP